MTLMRVSLFAVALVGLALVVGGVSYAQNPPPGPPGARLGRLMGPPAGPMGLGGLNLTQPQRDQIRALADARRERAGDLAARLRDLNRALDAELFADAPDQGRIEQLKIDLNLAHQQALDERIAGQLEVAKVLTPEQREALRAGEQGRGRFGRWGARGPGRLGRR